MDAATAKPPSLLARLGAALIVLVCLVASINKGMDIIEEQKIARTLREAESLAAVRELAKAAVHEALERPEGARGGRGGRHQTRDGGNAHLHEPLRN
jgi:maleate cis-trans isomerase